MRGGLGMRARRALLYMPGNVPKMAFKAAGLPVDTVCLDCEDAVAFNAKDDARNTIIDSLKSIDFGSSEIAVRINPIAASPFANDDLDAILGCERPPDAIVVPKVDHIDEVKFLADKFAKIKPKRENKQVKVSVLTQVESAIGLLNLNAICKETSTLFQKETDGLLQHEGIIFGGDDFSADVGATRTSSNKELLFARQNVVIQAKAFGLQALDIVHIGFKDIEPLTKESLEGASFGFTGKQIIHPNQIAPVQAAYSPTAKQIEEAREIVMAFREHEKVGRGAFSYKDMMIDMPTIIRMEKILSFSSMV